jgi:hypothetical protein
VDDESVEVAQQPGAANAVARQTADDPMYSQTGTPTARPSIPDCVLSKITDSQGQRLQGIDFVFTYPGRCRRSYNNNGKPYCFYLVRTGERLDINFYRCPADQVQPRISKKLGVVVAEGPSIDGPKIITRYPPEARHKSTMFKHWRVWDGEEMGHAGPEWEILRSTHEDFATASAQTHARLVRKRRRSARSLDDTSSEGVCTSDMQK